VEVEEEVEVEVEEEEEKVEEEEEEEEECYAEFESLAGLELGTPATTHQIFPTTTRFLQLL